MSSPDGALDDHPPVERLLELAHDALSPVRRDGAREHALDAPGVAGDGLRVAVVPV